MLRQKYYSDPNGHANNWITISKISGIIATKSVLSRKVARKAVAANMPFLTSVSVILIHPIIFFYFRTPYTLVWHKLHLMHPYWWRVVYRRCPQWSSPHVLNFILILNICVGYPIDISTITRTLPTIPECLESYSYLNFAAKPTANSREFIKNEKQAIFVSLIWFIFKASKSLISWLDPLRHQPTDTNTNPKKIQLK